MSTLILWLLRLLVLAALYLVLWRVVRASLRSVGAGASNRQRRLGGEKGLYSTAAGRESPVVVSLAKRAEPGAVDNESELRLLVLDHPGGEAPKGKRDVYTTGEEIPVYPPFRMGRMTGCDVVMRDRYSSGIHARLYLRGPTLCVEDLGSTNGTYVNGRRVKRKAVLQDGDVIQIGETSFLLKR